MALITEITDFEEVDTSEPFVVFGEAEQYPWQLIALAEDQKSLLFDYSQFLSSYSVLIETGLFDPFVEQLNTDGYKIYLFQSGKRVLEKHHEWSEPLVINGLTLPSRDGNEGRLFPYQQYAVRKGLDEDLNRHFLFANHGTGCIQGDAEVIINRAGNGVRRTLKETVRMFNGGETKNHLKWDSSIPTMIQREADDGTIRLAKIKAAWFSGIKETFTVTTDSGRQVRATARHPFFTERGWLRLDELIPGDLVHVRGSQRSSLPRQPKKSYIQISGLIGHPFSGRKGYKHHAYRCPQHRLVAEADLNGLSYDDFLDRIRRTKTDDLAFLDPAIYAVHHIDHNHLNNDLSNLQIMTHKEHHQLHADEGKTNQVLYKSALESVVSVEIFGEEETYDIEVEDEPHNFIVNGFVVHNTGKSVTACALAQEMYNRGNLDIVLFFTLRKNKINMMRAFNNFTQLRAVNIEGIKRKRQEAFEREDAEVYVMNYEKANFDFEILKNRIEGKRVLFILDEVQKILVFTRGKPNKSGQGIDNLMKICDPFVMPTSATIVNADPERYYNNYRRVKGKHPLGGITAFRKNYTQRIEMKRTPWGMETNYVWDNNKLQEVRHVVAPVTHTVRKTDPGVREYFKSTEFVQVPIQLSDEDRELYDLVLETANEDSPDLWGQYYRVLKYICNTPEALKHSESVIAKAIVERVPDLSSRTSSKMETLIEQVQSIKDQGDKCIVFSQYTNLGVFRIAEELERAKIKHVVHYGTGMTDKAAQMAQDEFKKDPSVIVFLSSDAGSHGLSFQEARYVINYDLPYSYDLLTQRNDRIDRADSYLDGLTSYVYITEDTVEERIWRILDERRIMSAAIQGTTEEFSRSNLDEKENLKFLIFGSD